MRQGTHCVTQGDTRAVSGILLDLDGVVYVGASALPGSLDAISRIRAARLPFKFITNTTRRPRRRIVDDLARLGLQVAMEDVYTPASIAHDFLSRRKLARTSGGGEFFLGQAGGGSRTPPADRLFRHVVIQHYVDQGGPDLPSDFLVRVGERMANSLKLAT